MAKIKKNLKKKILKKKLLKKKVIAKKIVTKKSPAKKIIKKVVKGKAPAKAAAPKALPTRPVMLVKDIMISNVQTVDQTMPIIEVAKLMTAHNIGAVVVLSPILDAVGIFTERDLLNKVVSKDLNLNRPILEVMTPRFICVQLQDEVEELPSMMIDGNFRHLPVVDGRKVVGMISIKDIVKVLLHENRDIIKVLLHHK